MNEGYVDFFVRNLYSVDASLSYYVFEHTYLLDVLVEELDASCVGWDKYEERLTLPRSNLKFSFFSSKKKTLL